MNIKKCISIILILSLMINNFIPILTFATTDAADKTDSKNQEVFYDDFSGNKLDTTKWLIAEKAWGGNNGGVVAQNVSVSDGLLKLEGHGDNYEGDIMGINKSDGKRTGAAVATKEYFGSGSYEVVAKVCPKLGACSAIWTFEYEEYYPGDEKYEELSPGGSYYAVNHEIDIEMPGRPEKAHENISYDYALCNTWIGEKGIIDKVWLDRVEEVVNYVLNNDMYCILDVHHDTGLCNEGSWIVADADKYEENAYKLKKLWEQIANRFKDYDYKLIFEGFNEIVDSNKNYDWVTGYDATVNVNKLNQIFVNTIRESGSKNKNRFLAVTTFGGITDEQKLSTFVMPEDTAEDRIILALHDYSSDSQNITKLFERIKKYCTDKNIPVILDEFGTTSSSMPEETRAQIAGEYVSKAKELGIACFWWDDGGNYILYDRRNMNWKYEKIKDAIINQYKDNNSDEVIVIGDIDGDGRVTVADLAKLKLHIIGTKLLTGLELEAADIDNSGEITVNDLALMKLILIGLLEIK